ncbi:MAG TPA: cytochrome c oxidase assembly protein [Gaiellaceae bacterium]
MHPYTWSLHAEAVVFVPLLALGYALVLRRYPASGWRVSCFLCGLALILAVFVTPLENLALHYLLTAHLLQNVALAEWAPALLVLGLPPAAARAARRSTPVRLATHPLVALPLWLATYYAWHLPAAYDFALRHPSSVLHLEHLCYLVTGILLWWPVLGGALAPGAAAAYLFGAFVLCSPLGLLLALIPHAVYGFYVRAPRLYGLSPLGDQQLAGLTMAAEEALVFFAAFALYFLRFLQREESALLFKDARWSR